MRPKVNIHPLNPCWRADKLSDLDLALRELGDRLYGPVDRVLDARHERRTRPATPTPLPQLAASASAAAVWIVLVLLAFVALSGGA